MSSTILHIYGPISIHAYGAAIAFGLTTFLFCLRQDKRLSALVNLELFNTIVTTGIFAGIVGGRLLYIISEWGHITLFEAFLPWIGGFSILGTIVGITAVIPLYLNYLKIPILPLLDLAALYAPLMQSISRIGCFFAGCCYGQPSNAFWAITYKHNLIAPCFISLHPTQLYSSFALFTVFLILYWLQYYCSKPGQLMCFYFIGIGIERFIVDFWRADRVFTLHPLFQILSIHQWIACAIVVGACSVLAFLIQNPAHTQKIRDK